MKRTLALALVLTILCIVLSLITLSMTGCSTIASALDIQNPRYTFRNVRPRVDIAIPLSASTIDFDYDLGIENPNRVGITLDRVVLDLLVDDRQLVNTVSQQGVRIPANGYGEAHLRSTVAYQNVRAVFNQIVDEIRGNRATYHLRGDAWYDTPAGTLRFPVSVYSTR